MKVKGSVLSFLFINKKAKGAEMKELKNSGMEWALRQRERQLHNPAIDDFKWSQVEATAAGVNFIPAHTSLPFH